MSNPNNPISHPMDSATFDGMELTEAEAALNAQPLDGTEATDPPEPAPVEPTPTPEPAPEPAPVAVAPEPAPQPAPVAPPPAPLFAEAPVASGDFESQKADLRAKFDAGDITTEEFVEQSGAITLAQAQYVAQKTIYDAEQKRSAAARDAAKVEADKEWDAEARAWEAQNADFLSNPLRAEAMREAIALIDKQTGGTLSPKDLLQRAANAAFEDKGWKPKVADPVREALASRAPDTRNLPTNLGGAPAAGGENIRGNEAFAALDLLDADALEDALARMPHAQREAYLADAPGARTTSNGAD